LAQRFEDMPAWQEARKLTGQIYRLTATAAFAKDSGLGEQIRQAAVSSMVNIAAWPNCASGEESAQRLQAAKRSIAEVQSLLYVALDAGHISADVFRDQYAQAARVGVLAGDLEQSLVEQDT
jgi:four helix bundle protein